MSDQNYRAATNCFPGKSGSYRSKLNHNRIDFPLPQNFLTKKLCGHEKVLDILLLRLLKKLLHNKTKFEILSYRDNSNGKMKSVTRNRKLKVL